MTNLSFGVNSLPRRGLRLEICNVALGNSNDAVGKSFELNISIVKIKAFVLLERGSDML
jgi:hypothetical protein